ncbi:MAG: DNA-binding domain-containing protein [Ramlibacter sp.]
MSGLAQQQASLLRALWQPQHADAMKDIANYVHPTCTASTNRCERGLQAYRSNGQALAQRVLASAYPVIAQLLGEENFAALALRHWQRHPPERGDLAQWGASFGDFLAAVPGLAEEEPYLADVARAEWALHAAATAADAEPDPASFALLAERDPQRLALVLGPGVQCFASAWPVVSIVHAHLLGEPALAQAGERIRAGLAETALVWRQGLAPRLRLAHAGEAAFVAALQENRSLADSLTSAPDLNFNGWLAPAAQSGLLLAVRNL